MNLNIDTTDKEFVVTKAPSAKLGNDNVQRTDKDSGLPQWITQVVVTDPSGGEIINITTDGEMPDLAVGDIIEPTHLVAIPWYTNGRAGVAYRARHLVSD